MSLYVKESSSPKAKKTLVFLHGLGVSSWMWEDQINVLKEEYQCLAIDLPGNGESYNTEWLSFADTAKQIATIIRQRAINGRASVVGLSLGGYAALHLLQHHPEVVESTIVSGVTISQFSNQWLWKIMVKIMPTISKWNFVLNRTAKMLQLPPEAAELYKRDSKRLSGLTYKRIYDEVLKFSLPQKWTQANYRLLAVAGDSEVKPIKNDLAQFSHYMPAVVTATAPNAHHGWNAEHPQLFINMVRAWVEEQPLPVELIVGAAKTGGSLARAI